MGLAGRDLHSSGRDCEDKIMIRRQDGFTIVELIITMAVFLLVIAMASQMFSGLLNQFKQQSKIAETNIEGVIGLQLLRADLEHAGYGLPYDIPGVSYLEADNSVATVTAHNEAAYNDAPTAVPRAFVLGDSAGQNLGGLVTGNSDVLIIKATNMGTSNAAHKWGYASNTGSLPNTIQPWKDTSGNAIADENFEDGDRVIVLAPTSTTMQRVLLTSGAAFSTIATVPSTTPAQAFSVPAGFQPVADSFETYLVYGIKTSGTPPVDPRMPFNRADYYIFQPTTGMPLRCAANTGILYKGTIINKATGNGAGGINELPILDCVLDMQVVLGTDNNGILGFSTAGFVGNAEQLRKQLKEIRVYILAHEGQKDTSYTSPATITASDPDVGDVITYIPTGDLRNYRWKIYTLLVKPYNLR